LFQVLKERDDALAQMGVMKSSLEQKCGATTAKLAMEKARLASAQLVEQRGQAQVKADQDAAKREAAEANKAMATARAAVAAKEKAKASLTAAQKQLKAADDRVQSVLLQSKAARDEAKRLAESGASDGEVKAAYAKASGLYATQMDAKMRQEMARKRVEELGGKVDVAKSKATKELLTAKQYTSDAATKVQDAMQAQVRAAKEKTEIAEKEHAMVKAEEANLLKESNTLREKITAAKAKSKKAHDALEMAQLSESRALEAVKLPAGATPEERKAFEEAKFKVLSEQEGGSVNYATKIQNIEARLLDAKDKVREATDKVDELTAQKNQLMSKIAAEADSVLKAQMETQITSLTGAIVKQQQDADAALKQQKEIEEMQKNQIKDVVEKVVLSQDPETTMNNEGQAAFAEDHLADAAETNPASLHPDSGR